MHIFRFISTRSSQSYLLDVCKYVLISFFSFDHFNIFIGNKLINNNIIPIYILVKHDWAYNILWGVGILKPSFCNLLGLCKEDWWNLYSVWDWLLWRSKGIIKDIFSVRCLNIWKKCIVVFGHPLDTRLCSHRSIARNENRNSN